MFRLNLDFQPGTVGIIGLMVFVLLVYAQSRVWRTLPRRDKLLRLGILVTTEMVLASLLWLGFTKASLYLWGALPFLLLGVIAEIASAKLDQDRHFDRWVHRTLVSILLAIVAVAVARWGSGVVSLFLAFMMVAMVALVAEKLVGRYGQRMVRRLVGHSVRMAPSVMSPVYDRTWDERGRLRMATYLADPSSWPPEAEAELRAWWQRAE